MNGEGIVQAGFRAAFPNHIWTPRPSSRYIRLEYQTGCSLYFRFSEQGNIARINLNSASSFPDNVQHYLRTQNVPDDGRDYLIGPEHVNRVIAILRNNQ